VDDTRSHDELNVVSLLSSGFLTGTANCLRAQQGRLEQGKRAPEGGGSSTK